MTKAVKAEADETKMEQVFLSEPVERDWSSRDADDEGMAANDDKHEEEEAKVEKAKDSRNKKSNSQLKYVIGKKKTKRQPSKENAANEEVEDGQNKKP